MRTTETAKSPSLFKAALLFAATAAVLALSSRAPAEPFAPAPHAFAGEPSVRIRGADALGVDPAAFADWIMAHPRPFCAKAPVAPLLARAKTDHDGWISTAKLYGLLLGSTREPQPHRDT
jgi:hypothetical protein